MKHIWEWVSGRYYGDYYSETPEGGWVNPTGPEGAGELRVLRGGCYQNFTTYSLRASRREFYYHYTRDGMFGFRCAQPAD
jgi:formylglycine-generating enzyme required for sulfatase activity